ncbi:hypothetical protein PMAYCL1PPCAC_29493, partial [Pristionchus mayeri]
IKMSVDRTIEELSGTLAQLGQLVGHINGQINGITSRINVTLDNFDRAITNIATDAGSVTGQVGETVSQVPNAWVFYVLFITLIIVFILLSIVLLLNLITKIHAIYSIIRSGKDGSEDSLIGRDQLGERSDRSVYDSKYNEPILPLPSYSTSAQQYSIPPRESPREHIAISMEAEPRRPGRRDASQPFESESTRPYQRRGEDGGKYNLETATASPFPRTIHASDI